jgi:hypothetical protein
MPLSFDNLRKGKKYRLRNYGEQRDFQVIDIHENNMYLVKDLLTLDTFFLHELIEFGKSKDFDLDEL